MFRMGQSRALCGAHIQNVAQAVDDGVECPKCAVANLEAGADETRMRMIQIPALGYDWSIPVEEVTCLALLDWERDVRDAIHKHVPNGGLFIVVGAHTGFYPIIMSDKFDIIVAVEPYEANVAVLMANLEANGLEDNMCVVNAAAWHEEAQVSLRIPPHTNTTPNASVAENPDVGLFVEVRGRPLPAILESWAFNASQLVNLLLIDVEGAGGRVLEGCVNNGGDLLARTSFVLLEVHDEEEQSAAWKILSEAGFREVWRTERVGGVCLPGDHYLFKRESAGNG